MTVRVGGMLRCLLTGLALAFLPARAAAHPGSGIVVGADGAIYVVVYGTNRIMRIAPDGRSSVLVDDERLRLPHHLAMDAAGVLYSASDFDGKVWRVGADGALTLHLDSAVLLLVATLFVAHTWTRRPRGRLDWASSIGATVVVLGATYGIRPADPLFLLGRHALVIAFSAGAWWSQRTLPRRSSRPPTPGIP